MSEFFLELFSEEVPARMQGDAMENLKRAYREQLAKAGIPYGEIESFSTPRRLGVVIDGLPDLQKEKIEEFRGPKIDAPAAALQGFLKSRNITIDQCTQKKTEKGTYWIYEEVIPSQSMDVILGLLTAEIIDKFTWPKSMRWSTYNLRWVRPLLSVVALFKGKIVPLLVPHTDQNFFAGNTTLGHRFLSPGKLELKNFKDYQEKTKNAYVLVDREERRKKIIDLSESLAKEHHLVLRHDESLLDELTGLVEWPSALLGEFEKEFLKVPSEVLIASMRGHQKYLSLMDKDGTLSNKFIIITNMPPEGRRKENMVSGNERVLRARLSDAQFFWTQDQKLPLRERNKRLKDVTFHAKLGTLDQKVERLTYLSAHIAQEIGANVDHARTAASLCKADLVTHAVGEFPELQGIMGMHYALLQGESVDVAKAIAEHYKPSGAMDSPPSKPISISVALADKIDTIAGFFAIGEKPTGSKDPYALRRAALGIIRIILDNHLRLSLENIFSVAIENYLRQNHAFVASATDAVAKEQKISNTSPLLTKAIQHWKILEFILDRMKQLLKDDIRADIIDSVFSNIKDETCIDLSKILKRLQSVQKFLATDEGAGLLAGYKRASNIVRIEQEKEKRAFSRNVQTHLLKLEEESILFGVLKNIQNDILPMLQADNYTQAMALMTTLQKPVDSFFEKVIVNDNDPDIRENRLSLLTHIQETMNQIANFSCVN